MNVTFKKIINNDNCVYHVLLNDKVVNEITVSRFKNGKIYAYIYNGFPHKYLYGAQGTARNDLRGA